MFVRATKRKQKLRLLLEGASGSGKTYSALVLAKTISERINKKIAVIDTEYGSASLYADRFEFDTMELEPPFTPEKYVKAIQEAAASKTYGILIIDSISHEWSGQGGCLDIQSSLGGTFNDWKKVTPRHQAFINTILAADIHIIGCARTKSEYAMEEGLNKSGKAVTKPVKVGTKTEQREGLEFEFTTIFRLNQNHIASVSKDRTSLFEGVDEIITQDTGEKLLNWLEEGTDPPKAKIAEPIPTVLSKQKPGLTIPEQDEDIHKGICQIGNMEELKIYYYELKEHVLNKQAFNVAITKRKHELNKELQNA